MAGETGAAALGVSLLDRVLDGRNRLVALVEIDPSSHIRFWAALERSNRSSSARSTAKTWRSRMFRTSAPSRVNRTAAAQA